jgi:large subunit ribosomal protein L24
MAVAQKKPAPGARAQLKKFPAGRIQFKKEDTVKVISGRDKGKTGRVLRVDHATGRILVEHIMMIKRHTRPNPSHQIKGGIAERESPIAVSNVMLVCPGCGKATRIGRHVDTVAGGKARRTRICLKCGQTLDRK